MSVIYYAVEVETDTVITDSTAGMTYGYMRFITDRPGYDGGLADTFPTGDYNAFNKTIIGGETMGVAFQSGQLYTFNNGIFKAANTVPTVGMRFTNISNPGVDFDSGEMLAAKGSALARGDIFEVTNNGSGTEAIKYVGVNKWFEDLITKDGMSNPSRRIDLSMTGDYGTLSGFNFSINQAIIAGTDTPMWKNLDSNDVFLTNKKVRVYAVIDGTFYQIWTGIVDNNPMNETDYKFICKSNFKQIFKDIPTNTFNETDYPNTVQATRDKPVPICIGDIEYAEVLGVSGAPDWLILTEFRGVQYTHAMATAYTVDTLGTTLTLNTWDTVFALNELVGKFLFVARGDGADTNRAIKILSNVATVGNVTAMVLAETVTGIDINVHGYAGSGDAEKRYHFRIGTLGMTSVVSNAKINEYKKDNYNRIQLVKYNKDSFEYVNISHVIDSHTVEDSDYNNTATIDLNSTTLDNDSDIAISYPIPFLPYDWSYTGLGGWNVGSPGPDILTDYDRSVSLDIDKTTVGISAGGSQFITVNYDCSINNYEDLVNLDELYIGIDIDRTSDEVHGQYLRIVSTFYDQYGREFSTHTFQHPTPGDDTDAGAFNTFNMLPNDYYRNNPGGDNGESSVFASDDTEAVGVIKDAMKLSDDVVAGFKTGLLQKYFKISITIGLPGSEVSATVNVSYDLKQVGIFGVQNIDIKTSGNYVKTSGELLADGTTETKYIYNAIRRILEDYNGIAASDIDYGNLSTKRNDWPIARQITKKKNTFDYLKELAKHSFIGVFQNRKGQLALNAWIDEAAGSTNHNETNITRGSISKFSLTSVDKVYNNFNIIFSPDPGGNSYLSQYQLKDADQAGQRGSSNFPWLWDVCRAAYLRYKIIKEYKIEMPWFNDRLRWYSSNDVGRVGISTDSSAYKFLENAVFWITRQKREVEYTIPIDATNVLLDLTDAVNFRDTIYTDAATDASYQEGNIYLMEYDLRTDRIKIGTILDPQDDIDEDYGFIIETGSAPDTITESGSQPDTITEDGI